MVDEVCTPYSFKQVKHLVKNSLLERLHRSKDVIEVYEEWSRFIKSASGGGWSSASDYIKHHALGFPVTYALDSERLVVKDLTDELCEYVATPSKKVSFSKANGSEIDCRCGSSACGGRNLSPVPYILRRNDFPYAVQVPVEHWCLWAVSAPPNESTVEEILNSELERLKLLSYDRVWFVNPMNRQTIRDLWHAHVFMVPNPNGVTQ